MNKNVTRLLTLGGVIGVITTAYAAIKGYEKTKDILEEHDMSLKDAFKDAEVRWKVVKAVAPAAVSAIATETCILGCQAVNARNIAILGGAAGAIGSQLKNLDRVMPKVMGREAWYDLKSKMNMNEAKKLFDEKTSKKFDKMEKKKKEDEDVYYDSVTKQYFLATEKDILLAEIALNKAFMRENEVSVADYISFFNKKALSSEAKDEDWGWYLDDDFDYNASYNEDGYYISLRLMPGNVDGDHQAIIITPSIYPTDPSETWYEYSKKYRQKFKPEPGDMLDLPFTA